MNRFGSLRLQPQFSRIRPFVGGAYRRTRDRASSEIDVRAPRTEREASVGVEAQLTRRMQLQGSVRRGYLNFDEGESFRGVDLALRLNRRFDAVQVGVRYELSPPPVDRNDGIANFDGLNTHSLLANQARRIHPNQFAIGEITVQTRGVRESAKTKYIYDAGLGFGGPIKRDRLWFYVAPHRRGAQQTLAGVYYYSMALVIMGGLAVSTFLTLVLLPTSVTLIEDAQAALAHVGLRLLPRRAWAGYHR